jgi:hypothetical protein
MPIGSPNKDPNAKPQQGGRPAGPRQNPPGQSKPPAPRTSKGAGELPQDPTQ